VIRHAKAPSAGSTQASGIRRGLFGIACLCVLGLAAFLGSGAPSASASQTRLHQGAFGSFTAPGSVAVDHESGDLYVLDAGDNTIRKLDSSGSPLAFSALKGSNAIEGSDAGADADQTPQNGFALDSAASQVTLDESGAATDGTIYVADSNHGVIDAFAPSGEYLGQLDGSGTPQGAGGFTCGLAVAANGDLYASAPFSGQINRYAASGAALTDADYDAQIDGLPFATACKLAVDSSGAVYAAPYPGFGGLTKYAPADFGTTSPSGASIDPNATAVAVDPANDDVYADNGNQISHYDSAGAGLEPPFGAANLQSSSGLAIGGETVYATDSADAKLHVFGPIVTVADAITGGVSNLTQTSVTLEGSVDPDGVALSECVFDYGAGANYGSTAPCVPDAASIPTGSGPVAVSADVAGLSPGQGYHFRLRAANADATTKGDDATFSTQGLALIAPLAAHPVGETTATIAAQVNPRNQAATTYQFEYGATTSYGNSAPAAPADLGFSDNELHLVTAELSGLSPNTTYHYRAIATNASGPAAGPDRAFTTDSTPAAPPVCPNAAIRADQGVTDLVDCRAYERVSPEDTNGFPVDPTGARSVSPDGGRVLFRARAGAAPDTAAGVAGDVLRATRGPGGWSSHTLIPDSPVVSSFFNAIPHVRAVSTDLTETVIDTPSQLTPSSPPVDEFPPFFIENLYMQSADGAYHLLNPLKASVGYEASTPDLSHVIYNSSRPQLDDPEIVDGQGYLYEWVGGQVRLASVLPDGTAQSGVSAGGAGSNVDDQHAISDDGSRVYFHVGGFGGFGQIYVRENGASTAHVSASQRAVPDPNGPLPAQFLAAEAAHGGKALFFSCEQLTEDSTASSNPADPTGGDCELTSVGGSAADKSDLYLYDVDAEELTDLTTADPAGADLAGFIGASDDLGRIYFVARGVLAPGGVAGKMNIYLWDHGTTTFIGLGLSEEIQIGGAVAEVVQDRHNWVQEGTMRTHAVRISANGRFLLLTLRADLTPYDNSGPTCPDDASPASIGRQCAEVYRYDAETATLDCISCPAVGIPSSGDSRLLSVTQFFNDAKSQPPSNLLEDGASYFETPNRLLPEDVNGAVDVYQFKEGRLRLISNGAVPGGGRFAEATPSGSDVFFTTPARLISSDRDSLLDLYDARVGGGFTQPLAPPACEGDACAPPPVIPNDASPASSSYSGPGNPSARHGAKRRCAKGRKPRKGKCAKHKRAAAKRTDANRRAGK
jgi:hypothetical protein